MVNNVCSRSRWLIYLTSCVLLVLSNSLFAQLHYNILGHPNSAVQHTAAVSVDSLIFVTGGWNGNDYFDNLHIFNAQNQTWSTGANYPIKPRGHSAALGSDGMIYNFSGYDGVAGSKTPSCYKYNPVTNSWTPITNAPEPVWEASAVAWGDSIYLVGGELSYSGSPNKFQIYNVATNTWSLGPNLPNGSLGHEVVAYNGKIYVVGGGGRNYESPRKSLFIFDVATNTWSVGASMATGRYQPGVVLNPSGKIIVYGGASKGFNTIGTYYNSVEVYDIATDTWSSGTSLHSGFGEGSASLVDGITYLIGGYDGSSLISPSPNPLNAITNNRGCIECDNYSVGRTFVLNNKIYKVINRTMLDSMIQIGADLSAVCISNITSFKGLFQGNSSFDQDISNWDVSGVTDMSAAFFGAGSFNQDISNWDVSNVTDMRSMFFGARAFNQDISSWDVSSVTEMSWMFSNAIAFNQDISGWDVSNVTQMTAMFNNARSFNQPLAAWDVSNVSDMRYMFSLANAINQDLSSWCVGNNILTEPEGFSKATVFGSGVLLNPSQLPVWGAPCITILPAGQ